VNHFFRSPLETIFLLLFCHFGKNWQQKSLKFSIIVVRNKDISDSTVTIESVFNVIHVEFSHVEGAHAFHDVFLNSSGCSNNAVDHLMLGKISDDIPHATRGHVRCVAKEDSAPHFSSIGWVTGLLIISLIDWLITKSPTDHLVDKLDGFMKVRSL
jgi:hypothetical protein